MMTWASGGTKENMRPRVGAVEGERRSKEAKRRIQQSVEPH